MLYLPSQTLEELLPLAETPLWRSLWEMEPEPRAAAVSDLFKKMVESGLDSTVVLAFLDVGPLVQERPALETLRSRRPDLTQGKIPEAATTNEAISLAIREHLLTPSQTKELRALLERRQPQL